MPRKQHESQRRLGPFTPFHRWMWRNQDFKSLPWDEKGMWYQINSYDGITAVGVVRADAEILAQAHPDRSAEDIQKYLNALVDKGWLVICGTEIFVRDWFLNRPAQLRAANNMTHMAEAVKTVGYSELRTVVIKALFDALLEIHRVDKTQAEASIKKICTDLATGFDVPLPDELRARR